MSSRRRNPISCAQCGRRVPEGADVCPVCDEPVQRVIPASTDWEDLTPGPMFTPLPTPRMPERVVDAKHEADKAREAAIARIRMHMRAAEAQEESSCLRSPCESDPKVTGERLSTAYREVGLPKQKVGRPPGLLYIAYGLGVDSTAILVGLAQLVREGHADMRPDYILFADTGVEKKSTYDYIFTINDWLARVGFPQVQVVAYATELAPKSFGSSRTLEQHVILMQHMPSISVSKFGRATCSKLWKQDAQKKWLELESGLFNKVGWRSYRPRPGLSMCKAIGFDAGEDKREKKGTFRTADDKALWEKRGLPNPFSYWYPLRDWGWDRARCIAEIEKEIGSVPPKSSCFFCGAMKPHEIRALSKDELLRAIFVEQLALNGWHAQEYADKADVPDRGLNPKYSWRTLALTEGLITPQEDADLMDAVRRVASIPPVRASEGGQNLAYHPLIRSLPAFRDILGFRGPMGRSLPVWDRKDTINVEGPTEEQEEAEDEAVD